MRPPSVYANPVCPAADSCDLLGLLHGPHRTGCRLVMILLSQQGFAASQIAGLLGYDPSTVRRWIHRYQRHGTTGAGRPVPQRPTTPWQPQAHQADPAAAGPAQGLDHRPAPSAAGPPRHLAADPAQARARGRLLAAAPPGCQGRPRPRPDHRRPQAADPRPAHWRGGAGRGRDPHQSAALGPLDLDRPRAAPADHDPGTNRRRTIFGSVDLRTGRFLYEVTRKAISASFTGFCEHLLAAYPAAPVVAVVCDNVIIHRSKIVQRWLKTHPRVRVLHGALQPPRQSGRAHLGHAQGVAGQQPHLDHPGPRPPGPRLLPRSQPGAAAGDRRTPQLTLDTRELPATLQASRLERRGARASSQLEQRCDGETVRTGGAACRRSAPVCPCW
jgi:hypothetical protein